MFQIHHALGASCRKVLAALSIAALATGAVACDQMAANKDTADKTEDKSAAKADGTAKAEDKKPSGPCDEMAASLCKETGEKSQSCGSAKSLATILSDKACKAQMGDMPATVAKIKEQRKKCDDLQAKLCKDLGEETQTCAMVREKTKEFAPARCEQMLSNYKPVISGLKKQEEKNKPLSADLQKEIAADDGPSFGPKDAKVTIVEFSDFECPYCSKAAKVANQVKEAYGDKVRFVFRQFPLKFHKNAHVAAQASLAAHKQGKFWEFHDVLFENSRALQREKLDGYAKTAGLNPGSFKKELDAKSFKEQVDKDMALGTKANVSGTPTMFVNGKRVANPTDFKALKAEIDKALAAG